MRLHSIWTAITEQLDYLIQQSLSLVPGVRGRETRKRLRWSARAFAHIGRL